jgi:hypothetical protein
MIKKIRNVLKWHLVKMGPMMTGPTFPRMLSTGCVYSLVVVGKFFR